MLRRKLILLVALTLALLISGCQPITRPEPQPPQGLRPDAPPYAVRGPFAVGARDFVMADGNYMVPLTVWYPALNPNQAKEAIAYQITEGITSVPDIPAAERILKGRALPSAAPDTAHGPYPLVIFSDCPE